MIESYGIYVIIRWSRRTEDRKSHAAASSGLVVGRGSARFNVVKIEGCGCGWRAGYVIWAIIGVVGAGKACNSVGSCIVRIS